MEETLLNKKDIIAYFLVAATGALTNILISTLSQDWFTITFRNSLIIGYIGASILGFFLTKLFAFNNKNPSKTHREMSKFAMVAVLSFFITVYGTDALFNSSKSLFGVFNFLLPYSTKTVNVNKLASQIFCMGISFLSNYILHKKFTFQNTGFYDRLKRLLFR